MRNKTDKNDARGIAHVLRTGWFSPVHMKSREAHGHRALLWERYGVTSVSLHRWLKNPDMDFPKPIYIGRFR